jgi:hypothetical protein
LIETIEYWHKLILPLVFPSQVTPVLGLVNRQVKLYQEWQVEYLWNVINIW